MTMLISTGGKDEKAKSGASLTQNLEPGVIMVGLKNLKCLSSVFHSGCLDFIKTAWDRELDAASLLPGKYTFEKYVTGAFLGEGREAFHKFTLIEIMLSTFQLFVMDNNR